VSNYLNAALTDCLILSKRGKKKLKREKERKNNPSLQFLISGLQREVMRTTE